MKEIAILDYGISNIWSVKQAFEFLGCKVSVVNDKNNISNHGALVLPGVGSFKVAMNRIQETGFDEKIIERIERGSAKILGICLGMQVLAKSGEEDGGSHGLGLFEGNVVGFDQELVESTGLKVPHVGFNSVQKNHNSRLFEGIQSGSDFYFVHSFSLPSFGHSFEAATCDYGHGFVAAIEQNNVFATQFHPEKSQVNGLKLIDNFLKVKV